MSAPTNKPRIRIQPFAGTYYWAGRSGSSSYLLIAPVRRLSLAQALAAYFRRKGIAIERTTAAAGAS